MQFGKPINLKDNTLEQSVLCSAFMSGDAAISCVSELEPEDFQYTGNRHVYTAIKNLTLENKPVDLTTVFGELNKLGVLDDGMRQWVYDTAHTVATSVHIASYIRDMKEIRYRRTALAYAEKIRLSAMSEYDITKVYEVMGSMPVAGGEREEKSTGELMQEAANRIAERLRGGQSIPGNETGFKDLDRLIGGIKNGELIVIEADPGVGKSVMVHQIGIFMALKGVCVKYFNYEMNDKQMGDRTLAMSLPFDIKKIKYPIDNFVEADKQTLSEAGALQQQLDKHLDIILNAAPTLAAVKAECKKSAAGGKAPGLIVVDYVQLMSSQGANKTEQLDNLSKGLKRLAKEFNCPVISIASLGKDGTTRGSKQIDYDVDQRWIMTRECGSGENKSKRAVTTIEVVKNRDGGMGKINLLFVEKYLKFKDMEKAVK